MAGVETIWELHTLCYILLLALKWGFLQQKLFCLQTIYFFHVLFDCNLFEINISYGFGDNKAINLLCQQPSAQLIVTLNAKHYIVEVHTILLETMEKEIFLKLALLSSRGMC